MEAVAARARIGSGHVKEAAVPVQRLRQIVLDDAVSRVGHVKDVRVADQARGLVEGGEGERRRHVGSLKELGVVADFSELHDEVHQALDAVVVVQARGASDQIGDRDVLLERAVHRLLTGRQVAVNVDLDLQEYDW